jgi:hypothetical protein
MKLNIGLLIVLISSFCLQDTFGQTLINGKTLPARI